MAENFDACDTLDSLDADISLYGRMTSRGIIEARAARTTTIDVDLHDETRSRLHARKLDQVYVHQAAAIRELVAGEDVVVATGTASGKSLCYQVPIVDSAVRADRSTALMLFPTKALANDQLQSLRSWLVPGLKAVTYDGDTHPDDRVWARKNANVLLTNPEMLHMGMLPSHQRWATFFMRLRYVVIDELHALRGIFGSHVAQVLRRLLRVCAHYGSTPTFCFASATIGNPASLASALIGRPVLAIDDDGSPTAERHLVCWERPLLDPHTGVRGSANMETAMLLGTFVRDNQQTLAFCRGRQSAELVAGAAKRALAAESDPRSEQIAAYRGGFLGDERRKLERAMTSGELRGVAATNALELGINVGGLDAVILNGFPGTLASMRQQAGRAGRSGQRSAAVVVIGDDQLDQWYAAHPAELLTRPAEAAVINPDNPFVAIAHVECAAHELPLTPEDAQYFGATLDEQAVQLVRENRLVPKAGKLYYAGGEPPAYKVGLRTGSSATFHLIERTTDREVGTADDARVHSIAHPGAVYLHQGQQYRVIALHHDERVAYVEAYDEDEYTQPRSITDIEIRDIDDQREVAPGVHVYVGTVEVSAQVVAYQRKVASTRRLIETLDLDLPARVLVTRSCWYTIEQARTERVNIIGPQILGAVHAAEHGLIGLLPLFAICDRWDVGGLSMAAHPQTADPTIFIYDGYPGGAGIAEMAFEASDRHIRETRALIARCQCDAGCPSCVQSPKCGNWNEYLDKAAAIRLLDVMQS